MLTAILTLITNVMKLHIRSNDLSDREFQIMELVSKGKFNKEIADLLEIKLDTTAKHVQHIFRKLGVQNRTEATLKFLEMTGRIILIAV
jgi:DNA-binding NarL/FixJ family response regulator